MRTTVHQNELQSLERWLQGELEARTLHPTWQVRCALKQNSLMVVAQHPAAIAPDVQPTFDILEHALRHLESDWLDPIQVALGNPTLLPVQFYLRRIGQQQPYASASLSLEPITAHVSDSQEPFAAVEPEPLPTDVEGSGDDRLEPVEAAIADLPFPQQRSQNPVQVSVTESAPGWLARLPFLSRIPIPVLMMSTAIGFFVLGSGLYVLTRPCVIGGCAPLETAQQLSQQSAEMAQPTSSAQDVVTAHQQLLEANYLLSTIPSWSAHYSTAQTLLKSYEVRTAVFEQVVTALQIAQVAAEKSQNAPHPLSTWREVQLHWQEAIALLEAVPPDSPVYLFSQRKRGEYETNLVAINHRIRVEQQAQERIDAARNVAKVAETREAGANSVASWKSVYETWEVVINALKNIPQGTMAYAEAQQLLGIYQPRLTATRDRHSQEAFSANAYNQALSLAEQARQAEQRQQWSEAVNQWRDALSNVEQVPNGTSYHSQIEPLVTTYQSALASAQDRMRAATTLEAATSKLDQTCQATSTICTYTIQPNAIQVQLTPDYDWAIEAVISNAQLTGDSETQAALKEYVDSLLSSFAEASQQAQRPLDLYNSGGIVFGTYDPQFGGYVRR